MLKDKYIILTLIICQICSILFGMWIILFIVKHKFNFILQLIIPFGGVTGTISIILSYYLIKSVTVLIKGKNYKI